MTTVPERPIDLYPSRGATDSITPRADPVVWGEPGAAGPFSREDLAALDRDGFLDMAELITADDVALYRRELQRLTDDPNMRSDPRAIVELNSQEIRSIFQVHKISEVFDGLTRDPRILDRARQSLGSEVYIHQSRVNLKPGFGAAGFYWHSDFETWHAEDGLPRPRAITVSIALTENFVHNGPLMVIPGSHKIFVGCAGETPRDHYKQSLRSQYIGVPSRELLSKMTSEGGIRVFTGKPGSAVWFDCNAMHGSGDNITPYPRANVFLVFNSVENAAVEPFSAPGRRPEFIAARDFTPVRPR